MEERKLIRLGNSSFAVALPKDWIDKSGLKKGDKVFILPNSNGELMVSSEFKKNGEKKVSIDLDGKDTYMINKEAAAAYVKGYDLICFRGKKDKKKIGEIKDIANSMFSMDIIENTDDLTILKDFFNLESIEQSNFIRRIDNNLREMINLVIENIKNRDFSPKKTKEVEEIDNDINKLYLLYSRIMFKGLENPAVLNVLKMNSIELFNNWWLSFNLESIGDNLKSIPNILENTKLESLQTKRVNELIVKIQKLYIETLESFYKGDKEIAMKVSRESQQILKDCDKILKSDNIIIVQIASKLKEIETACYQNAKIILYLKT